MSDVVVERRDGVLWVIFDRAGARNAMTWEMYGALEDACDAAAGDPSVRALVLAGNGGKAFVAGTDIAQFRAVDTPEAGVEYERTIDRVVDKLDGLGIPTVAVVDGYAVGAGLILSVACDLRIVTPAARFGMPVARTLGNCLSMANYARLAGAVGEARVKELLLTARMVDAETALAWGLATEVVDAASARDRAQALCEQVAGYAPITVRVTKTALRRLRTAALPDGDDLVGEAYGSADFAAGVESFLSKGTPEWQGR